MAPSLFFLMTARICLARSAWSCFFLASKMSPSFLAAPFYSLRARRKYASSIFSGILTAERSIEVEVATTKRWFTRRRGQPLTLKGPVTRSSPVERVLRTITLLPLCTPATMMAMVPAFKEGLTTRLWFEKHLRVFLMMSLSVVGKSLAVGSFLEGTFRVPPFLAPLTFFSMNLGAGLSAFLAPLFLFFGAIPTVSNEKGSQLSH